MEQPTIVAPPAVISRAPSLGAVLLALALPPVFTHIDYQPTLDVGALTVQLADVAVVVVGVYALIAYRHELRRLAAARWIWIATAAFFAWILVACFYPLLWQDSYRVGKHLVSALKWYEYVLLAIAPALVLRTRRDVHWFFAVLAGWTALAALVAVTQFLGAGWFDAWGAGSRQPSFVGTHDLAAVGGAAVLAGLVALARARDLFPEPWVAWLCLVAGGIAFVLGGATAGVVGLALACAALLVVTRLQHVLLIGGACLLCTLGVLAIRSKDFADFTRFVGLRDREQPQGVQTYSQRTVLAYVGGRVWLDHPVVGVGWHGSDEFDNLAPYLDDARRKFPDQHPQSFPSAAHPYGVQTLYVEALADLGVIGFALLLAWLAAALWVAWRGPPPLALVGLTWVLLVIGLWSAEGFTSGIPLDGVTWLGIGFAVAAAARAGTVDG
jgi:O-antigen ligase